MTTKDILVRNIPDSDVARLKALMDAWPHDISQAEACRIAIKRGLDASPELQPERTWDEMIADWKEMMKRWKRHGS